MGYVCMYVCRGWWSVVLSGWGCGEEEEVVREGGGLVALVLLGKGG